MTMMLKYDKVQMLKKNHVIIMFKSHAHLQTMNKTSGKFQKDQNKTARVVLTMYPFVASMNDRMDKPILSLLPLTPGGKKQD